MFERAASLWNRLTRRPVAGTLAGADEDDRRLSTRLTISLETRVTPATGAPENSVGARILDVSSGGVRLEVGRFFDAGDLLTLDLPPRADAPPTSVLACVVHTQADGDERWILGCRFSAELDDADLAALGAARTRPDLLDNRNWSRFPCQVKAVYQVVPEDDVVSRQAKVLNVSAGGLALVVEHDVRPGALLSAELHAADGHTVVTILACVVHVTVESQHERVLGCNFIQELSEADLLALT